jgi:hypothetical protein
MRTIALLLLACLAGCQTTMDPNYALAMESYRLTITSQQSVEIARARAEEARYNAISAIGAGDPASRQMAIMALALTRGEGFTAAPVPVSLPVVPESQEARAFKWAALFAGPAISLVQGYFGYRLGVEQSRNTADSTIASYNVLGSTALAGLGTAQGIATTGFGAVQGTATTGFGTIGNLAGTLTRPNFTVTNNGGVIGSGSWVGPNSGSNSGNSGRINSDDNQRNCSSVASTAPPTAGSC